MKKIAALLFVLSFFNSSPLFAQEDSVDTSAPSLISLQVMQSRQKKHEEILGNKIENNLPAVIRTENKVKSAKIESSTGSTAKIILLASASAIVFLFVLVRRIKLVKTDGSSALRKNVKLMREEKVIRLNDPKLKKTRVRIAREEIKFNTDKVAQLARQLNISKGELQLAARLRQTALGSVNKNVLFDERGR